MNVPSDIDPLGNGGYEFVESIYGPAGMHWVTNIPIRCDYKMTSDVELYPTKGSTSTYMYFVGENTAPTDTRIYYLFGSSPGGSPSSIGLFTGRYSNTRLVTTPLYSLTAIAQRRTYVAVQGESVVSLTITEGGSEIYAGTAQGGSRISKDGTFLLKAHHGTTTYDSTAARIYRVTFENADTGELVADYVPFRKRTGTGYRYGLYDAVTKTELPVAPESTTQPQA